MRSVATLLGISLMAASATVLRAESAAPACPENRRITTEKDAIDYAKKFFVKRQKLIRRIGGPAINNIARNLSGDCCEVMKDQRGWHVDMVDKRDNPKTVFSYSFDECGTHIESRYSGK